MADAGAAHVGADDLHGVHYGEAGGGAGDGDEDWCEGVFDFDAHLVGEQFELGEQVIALPGAQCLQTPEGELQVFLLFLNVQLVACKAGFSDRHHAAHEEASQWGEIAQGGHARLSVWQCLQQGFFVKCPTVQTLGELLDGEVLANPQAAEPIEFFYVENRAT